MSVYPFEKLAPIIDDEVLYSTFERLTALAAPIAAMRRQVVANSPIAYDANVHNGDQYKNDSKQLLGHIAMMMNQSLIFLEQYTATQKRRNPPGWKPEGQWSVCSPRSDTRYVAFTR